MLTDAERSQACRDLTRAWGDRVEIETQPDGSLAVDVSHDDGGHTFTEIGSPDSYMLAALTRDSTRHRSSGGSGSGARPDPKAAEPPRQPP